MKLWPRNIPVSSGIPQRFSDLKATSATAIRTQSPTLYSFKFTRSDVLNRCGFFFMLHYLQLCSLPTY